MRHLRSEMSSILHLLGRNMYLKYQYGIDIATNRLVNILNTKTFPKEEVLKQIKDIKWKNLASYQCTGWKTEIQPKYVSRDIDILESSLNKTFNLTIDPDVSDETLDSGKFSFE